VDCLFFDLGVGSIVDEVANYCHVLVSSWAGWAGRGSSDRGRKDCFGLCTGFRNWWRYKRGLGFGQKYTGLDAFKAVEYLSEGLVVKFESIVERGKTISDLS
jgi:hypothetical protein